MLEGIVGKKGIVTTQDHMLGEVMHNGLGLCVQRAKHFVGAPTTNKTNSLMVDVCTKKCHSSCSA
jgi:hypothetical protein